MIITVFSSETSHFFSGGVSRLFVHLHPADEFSDGQNFISDKSFHLYDIGKKRWINASVTLMFVCIKIELV